MIYDIYMNISICNIYHIYIYAPTPGCPGVPVVLGYMISPPGAKRLPPPPSFNKFAGGKAVVADHIVFISSRLSYLNP